MTEINRRFSRVNWSTQNNKPRKQQHPPLPSYSNNNNNSNSNVNVNVNVLTPTYFQNPNPTTFPGSTDSLGTAESHNNEGNNNNTTAAGRRRFSVKLKQPDSQKFSYHNAPALPMNAQDLANDNSSIHSGISQLNNNNGYGDMLTDMTSNQYNASNYVRSRLIDADATAIDNFANQLETLYDTNNEAVKYTMDQSMNQVLQITSSVANTKDMLKSLKKTVNSLNDLLYQQLEEAQEYVSNEDPSFKVNHRQSMLILQQKWNDGLKSLYNEIEKSQELLPPVNGRHVILESKRWGELNAISWKPIRPAHFVILNDHILIATRKRTDDKKRTMATHCWHISDVVLLDKLNSPKHVKTDSSELTLCLRAKDLSFLFQTDSLIEFNKVRDAFKKSKAECANLKENEKTQRESLRNSISRLSANVRGNEDVLHDLSNKYSHTRKKSLDATKNNNMDSNQVEKLLNEIDENMTNVEIFLGHHKFEESVGFLNRLNDQLVDLIGFANRIHEAEEREHVEFMVQFKRLKLDKLTDQLINLLFVDVADLRASDETILQRMALFKILKKEDKGREYFLKAKTEQLNDLVAKLKFDGDLRSFILQLSIIYFRFVEKVWKLYCLCFDNHDNIYIINWGDERLNEFCNILRRQLADYDNKLDLYVECIDITKRTSKSLKDLGLNIDYLLDF